MKKVFLTLAVVFGMIASANAQLVVGGGINFGGTTEKLKTKNVGDNNKETTFNFGFTPKVGYLINEKLEVGAGIGLNYEQQTIYTQIHDITDPANPGEWKNVKDRQISEFTWAIKPYARYRFFEVNGFGFWVEGIASLGTSIYGDLGAWNALANKTKYFAYGSDKEVDAANQWRSADAAKESNKKADGYKYSKFNGSFYVQPVLTYTINEHWVLESQLSLLSLGVEGYIESEVAGTGANKQTHNYCSWGLGLFQGRALTFGVSYKF